MRTRPPPVWASTPPTPPTQKRRSRGRTPPPRSSPARATSASHSRRQGSSPTRYPVNVAENHVSVQAIGTSSVLEALRHRQGPENRHAHGQRARRRAATLRTKAVLGPSTEEFYLVYGLIKVQKAVQDSSPSGSTRHKDAYVLAALMPPGALALAMPPEPTVIDKATLPDKPEASGIKAQMAVGGLLGLAVGLALASVVEALRPTIVSSDALARELLH